MDSALFFRVAMLQDFLSRDLPGFGEQRIRLVASFQCPRLDPSGAQANPRFSNQEQ